MRARAADVVEGRQTDDSPDAAGAGPRVVIVHDFMETYGGAERVLCEIAQAFPEAPVVAILGRQEVAERVGVGDRFTSLLPQSEALFRHYRLLTPFLPALVDRLRIPEADVVLSSSYAFAHRLRPRGDAVRVCYCHSPLRFAWSMTSSYAARWSPTAIGHRLFHAFASVMRSSDRRAASEVSRYLTQSEYTADQIRRFYGHEPDVVGAPLDCAQFVPSGAPPEDHYLLCARLVEPYKKVSVVLEAFRLMPDERLVIAGDGPAGAELRALGPPNVRFVGHLDDGPLVDALQRCKALLFPSRDDFGLMPLEAMACGRPVLAYRGGGALHTVVPGLTGELFEDQRPETIVDAVRAFDPAAYDPASLRARAERWDATLFRTRLQAAVAAAVEEASAVRAPVADRSRPVPAPARPATAPRVLNGAGASRRSESDTAVPAGNRTGRFARHAPTGGEPPSIAPVTSDA